MVSNFIGVGTPDLATRCDKDQKKFVDVERPEGKPYKVLSGKEESLALQTEAQQPHKAPKNYESRPSKAVQFDTDDHLPVHSGKKEAGRCKSKGCKGKSHFRCQKCDIYLGLSKDRNCFFDFHSFVTDLERKQPLSTALPIVNILSLQKPKDPF
ncbi:hypothetical protein J6590_096542 [Homalodisca vitripennis]|nr:hypothetical protein J6590_096542 [Homalodisca vitripennis]